MVRPGSFCHSKARNDVNKKAALSFFFFSIVKDSNFYSTYDKLKAEYARIFLKILIL